MKQLLAKVMAALLILTLLFTLAACGPEQPAPEASDAPTAEESAATEAPEVTEETGDVGVASGTDEAESVDLG